MTRDECERLIDLAIDALLTRGGGVPEGCRAVVRRDRVGDPDRWQGWFREATGLKVFVSTEAVFTLRRTADGTFADAKVQLPEALRAAVREPGDGPRARGGTKSRALGPQVERVAVPCPGCGVERWIARHPGNVERAKRARCAGCAAGARNAARKGAPA